jgi:RND family efflux transporter MFP subunit
MKKNNRLVLTVLLASSTLVATAEPLATVPVQYREVAQTYSAEGVVEATRQSTVSAQISGRVKEISFDVGDRVRKGQIILRIDESEANQGVAGSQARVLQAQAALQNAKVNYERSKQLLEQKFISQSALDKAESDYRMAQAQAAASQAGAEQSALTQAYTSVVSPYAGVVAARMVELGEMVTVGKPLMTGFDPTQMRAIVSVPQYKLAELGQRPVVSIEIPSLSRWIKPASVVVQPTADARTHSTLVKVSLRENESGVYPGMFVRAHFEIGKAKKMLIPVSAVVRRSEVVAVYVVDDKSAINMRQVRVSDATMNGEVEVLSGLTAGERVAVDAVKAGMEFKNKK